MINYKELDKKVRKMVAFFNAIGLKTKFSCEGHEGTLNTRFMIMFDDSVQEKDINNFLIKYSDKYNHTPFVGSFYKWNRKDNNQIVSNWIYMCSYGNVSLNQFFADEDLEKMLLLYSVR